MSLSERIQQVRQENPGVRVDCYILFESHTDAMQLYELSRAAGLGSRISTTPRQAKAYCGVALLVQRDEAPAMLQLAYEQGMAFENMIALDRQIDPKRDRYC